MPEKRPVWIPDSQRIEASNMKRFMAFLRKEKDLTFEAYHQLEQWSVRDISGFWQYAAEFLGIQFSHPPHSILEGRRIQTAKWFPGATLNFAEHLLRKRDESTAIAFWSENQPVIRLSYEELFHKVQGFAHGLKALGVTKGDRVAAFISNRPEAIIGMLATSSIGAIWSSCSPDFGFQGVLDRFGQIKPKVLIAVDGYSYNGTFFDTTETLYKVMDSIPEIEKLIVISSGAPFQHPKSVPWDQFLCKTPSPLAFEQVPFDHPLYIMYSSGTTGKPKCMVHGTGGTLLQHLKELVLHTNLKSTDSITYFTTCGWMMWNWLVSSLCVGAKVVLFDGSPSYPDLSILFEMIEKERITIFGTSPKFLSACESHGLVPAKNHDMDTLQTILSTGSPLSDANFDYVYHKVKADVQLASISGGTDIISCFMLGNPLLPVYKGEIQCRGLGMKVETFNEAGQPVLNTIGELVCTAPFPSRPVFFWQDPEGHLYEQAYFSHFEGVWRHGDYVLINDHGGCIVFGRSDATLNPGGVRIGTAEIYGPVEAIPGILDSIVVGKKESLDTKIVLFVVLKPGMKLDDAMTATIRNVLKKERSPRHVPAEIHQVPDIPRTISGKKVELAVTKVIHGEPVDNKDALKNPETLRFFEDFAGPSC